MLIFSLVLSSLALLVRATCNVTVGQGEDYFGDIAYRAIELQVCCNETVLELSWTILANIASVGVFGYECYDNLNQVRF